MVAGQASEQVVVLPGVVPPSLSLPLDSHNVFGVPVTFHLPKVSHFTLLIFCLFILFVYLFFIYIILYGLCIPFTIDCCFGRAINRKCTNWALELRVRLS